MLGLTTCFKYDVVVVPFPFTESSEKQKPRPVAVLSNKAYAKETGNFIGVMISSSGKRSSFDTEIQDLDSIGLTFESWFKPKIATLPVQFIKRNLGQLSNQDQLALDVMVSAITA
jgi:mRNA interferase MazF